MAKSPETAEPKPKQSAGFRLDPTRLLCLLVILISLVVSFARLLETPPIGSANDKSRWATVWSLVERETYQIDEIIQRENWDTIDKVRHDEHFYSSKPPLFSTMVAGLYWFERATIGWTLDADLAKTVRLLLVIINFVPWGIAIWVLSGIVIRYSRSQSAVIFITAAAAWATLLTPFLTTLNNHLPGAICVIFTLAAAMRITIDDDQRWWWFALSGFFAALACTFELPAAIFGLAIFGLLVWRNRPQTLKWFLPFAAVPLLAFFLTNFLVTGGIRPFYMFYGTEKYEYVHEGVPSYWMHPQGLDRATDSTLEYLLHCTIGHHGIFSLTPIFLVSLVGWVIGLRRESGMREYHAMGLALLVIVLGYFLTRTENYNYGGNSVALRWLLWLVPFLLLALLPALEALQESRWFRITAVVLLLVSVFSAWYPFSGPWQSPWLFRLLDRWDVIDYSNPPVQFEHPVHSWLYQLPDGPRDPDYWVELSSVDAEGRISTIRVEDAGPSLVNQRLARIVRIVRTNASGQSSQLSLTIDVDAFREGASIEEFLLWPGGTPSENTRRQTARFLSGLPRPVQFFPMSRVYRKAELRPEKAFECITGGVEIVVEPTREDWPTRRFACLLVVSNEVPFGILKFETQVLDRAGGSLHAVERWAIHDCGKFLPRGSQQESQREPADDAE